MHQNTLCQIVNQIILPDKSELQDLREVKHQLELSDGLLDELHGLWLVMMEKDLGKW